MIYKKGALLLPDVVHKVETLATASLPAAGADQDGKIVIEAGSDSDNRNIIFYTNGQRFRVDGTSF